MVLIPMKSIGQTPYRQYADEGIMLNFFDIGNPDFRLYLLYHIELDDRFLIHAEDEYGLFDVTPSNERFDNNFFDTFETF